MKRSTWARSAALISLATMAAGVAAAQTVATTQAPPAPPPPPPPPTVATSWSGGSPRTTEEDRIFKINGRIMYDVNSVSTDGASAGANQNYTRAFARRAFLGVEGQFTENWKYNIKLQFSPNADTASSTNTTALLCQNNTTQVIVQRTACVAGETSRGSVLTGSTASGGSDEVGFDDAFIQYVVGDWEFTLGQNNKVSNMEDATSSLNIPFNERAAFVNAFGFAKLMGVAVNTGGGNWSVGAGAYFDDLNNPEANNVSETVSGIVRGTWAPIFERTEEGMQVLHLGALARYRDNSGSSDVVNNRGTGFRYRARPQTGYGDRFVDTGSIAFAQDTFYGVEAAYQYNNFAVEGEYGVLKAKPQSGTTLGGFAPEFKGGYFDIFWSPTGENRNYNAKDGTFGRITPRRTLGSDGGFGALTLGARYDFLDLTDGTMDGGEQKGVTLQATWQPLSFVKFQLDVSKLDIQRPNSLLSGDAQVVTLRSQIEW